MKKRGVSPVIATVLLIAIVIMLAVIIFIWATGFLSERAQKAGRAVELSCAEVSFEAGLDSDDEIGVVNRGSIPIYAFNVKALKDGTTLVYKNLGSTIGQGGSGKIDISEVPNDINEFLVVPVILGEAKEGKVEFPCPDQYGYAVA